MGRVVVDLFGLHRFDDAQLVGQFVDVREQIADHRARLIEELESAEDSRQQADAQPDWAYPALVASWAVRRIEGEIELADSMLIDLDRLAQNR